jgi:hypothetical protein
MVVYGVDIGVYCQGASSQILSKTKMAWARVHACPGNLRVCAYRGRTNGAAFCGPDRAFRCGKDLGWLSRWMARDLRSGHRLALGFEAPMWLPTFSGLPTGRFSLYDVRFPAERGCQWYLQAGAAASVKALSVGCLLLSRLLQARPGIALTTNADDWLGSPNHVFLFEAFVVEPDYKVPCAKEVSARAKDEWDAFTAAASFWALHAPGCNVGFPARLLHAPHSHPGKVLSLWKVIADRAGVGGQTLGDLDCEVVGLQA